MYEQEHILYIQLGSYVFGHRPIAYIYVYCIYIYTYIYIYIYIYIAAVVRMMQKSISLWQNHFIDSFQNRLSTNTWRCFKSTCSHTDTQATEHCGINPHSDCFYCLSTRFSCYASFNCDSFILSVKCANPKLSNLCSCPQILFPASSGMRLLAVCNTVNTTQAINTHLCTMQFPHFYTPYIITVLMHSAAATLTSHKTSGMTV